MPKVPWSCSNWCSGSLEDKVKFKERVQWARRAIPKRGTIIENKNIAGKAVQRRPLRVPQDPLHLQSGNQFYFQRLFLTNSVSQFHSCTIELSPKLSSFSISYGGLLGTSWDQSIRTPWRCGYTHISSFPRRSGGFVPVTHAARECTAFGDLRSLAKSRWFRVGHLSRGLRRLGNLAVRWWRQWWRLESWGKKRKEDAWGIGQL